MDVLLFGRRTRDWPAFIRASPALLPPCCRLGRDYWTIVQSKDRELVNAVLSGRALLNRFDGEWWMRPRPEPTLAPLAFAPGLAAVGSVFGEIPVPV